MQKKQRLQIPLTILFLFALSFTIFSCSPLSIFKQATATLPSPLVETVDRYSTKTRTSSPPTATLTLQPTATPTPTITMSPTKKSSSTPTLTATRPTATTTATYLSAGRAPRLQDMQITWDDVTEYYDRTNTALRYIEVFFESDETYVSDSSIEVSDGCLYDCSKQVWSTNASMDIGLDGEEFLYFRKVVIFMFRSKNEDTAKNLAENLYEEFIPFEFEWEEEDYKKIDPPKGSTRAAIGKIADHDGFINVLTTSKGHIALMVVSYVPPFSDDAHTELELAIHFANIQIDKLRQSAVIP